MGISLPCLCFNRLPLPGRPCPQGTKEVGGRLGGDQTSCLVNSFEGALFAALSRTLKVDKTSPPHSLNEPKMEVGEDNQLQTYGENYMR
mmetsp:Transcript_41178/g.162524  ORF Transcript_41178/g.162524 Transcript_41178/m.162524 type:complete len:89 (+) Transcript_41178:1048-1314(+)